MSYELSARSIFREFFGSPIKRLGQNFLFDENINRKIVSSAGDLSGKTVLEVGAGPGGLTLEILKSNVSKLHVVELDPHWANVWRTLQAKFDNKLEVIESDALKVDFKLIKPDIIISNLPYNISTQLLFKWLREFFLYEKLILMFQKEVADRLYAIPCTKEYGRISVLTQSVSNVSKVFDLEPGSFTPAPNVKSTVVKIVPHTNWQIGSNALHSEKRDKFLGAYKAQNRNVLSVHKDTTNGFNEVECGKNAICRRLLETFSDMLNNIFMHRRKIVSKSLGKYFSDPILMLKDLGYDSNTRPEQIKVDDYVQMFFMCSTSFLPPTLSD
jgi:16S rRNA (adenine1518-N6/adenine1519-N6)-dimethyltransferase